MIGSAGKELLALLVHHRIDRPHALKIPARRADSTLTENVASPFQAEPRQEHLKQFIARNSKTVAQIIKLNRTDLPLGGLETKTATLILDFLIDCPRRPMRCLSLDQMLHVYAERITGEWL
jgi:dsDNA-binding SOS-regulon protein